MRVLVVNAGSSSLKLRVLDDNDAVAGSADLPPPGDDADAGDLAAALESLGPVEAVGHRIVHGGTLYSGPVLINDRVETRSGH